MKTCAKCGTQHTKNGTYCSRSCANSRVWSDEDKLKKSEAAKGKTPWHKGLKVGSNPDKNKRISETQRSKHRERFEAGEIFYRNTLRKYVIEHNDTYECSVCSISEWQGKPITLQIDHIDGCAANNTPSNLRLICPNCHSQTDTFGGKNKGYGRKSLGVSTF